MTFLDTPPRLTEKGWMKEVMLLAHLLGWRVYHVYDSRKSAAGFPDLVLVRRPRVIFAELKSDRGRLTPAQRDWFVDLKGCTVESYVWRPKDIEAVTRLLR